MRLVCFFSSLPTRPKPNYSSFELIENCIFTMTFNAIRRFEGWQNFVIKVTTFFVLIMFYGSLHQLTGKKTPHKPSQWSRVWRGSWRIVNRESPPTTKQTNTADLCCRPNSRPDGACADSGLIRNPLRRWSKSQSVLGETPTHTEAVAADVREKKKSKADNEGRIQLLLWLPSSTHVSRLATVVLSSYAPSVVTAWFENSCQIPKSCVCKFTVCRFWRKKTLSADFE